MYEKALGIHRRIGDVPGMARHFGNLATIYTQKGNTAKALEYHDRSLKIAERIGDQNTSAHQYLNLGNLYRQTGDRDQARRHYEKAKALFEMLGLSREAQEAARALETL